MTGQDAEARAKHAIELIRLAFANRPRPTIMTDSKQLSDVEYEEVMAFEGVDWRDVTFDQVEQYADAVFWFAPDAFCYYLPGFLAAGPANNRTDSNAYDALIGMLDRSAEPAYWDEFFTPRWTLLSPDEIDAVVAWVAWMQAIEPDAFHANSYERALETLALLRARRTAEQR